jgi:hypothetical protein
MHNFTPVSAILGGGLIGLAASLLWLANGRIAGVSGIVGNLGSARAGDIAWRVAFIAGLASRPFSSMPARQRSLSAVYWWASVQG